MVELGNERSFERADEAVDVSTVEGNFSCLVSVVAVGEMEDTYHCIPGQGLPLENSSSFLVPTG